MDLLLGRLLRGACFTTLGLIGFRLAAFALVFLRFAACGLFFLRFDAEALTEAFGPGEVDRIYLNFSDPWPKDRHHKRRLTSREYLSRYEEILSPGGFIEFKTDNTGLFDFSLQELEASGWIVTDMTRNLHKSPMNEGNVMTEYEEKFSILGNKICKLIAHPTVS